MNYTTHFSTQTTPQNQPVPGQNQVPNSAGGYGFEISKWSCLERFLLIGTEGGTYYVSEKALTITNANSVIECIKENGVATVEKIVNISAAGKAPKNDPAIFALALCCTFGNEATKKAAYNAIVKVCRIPTHLFTFCSNIHELRGWSRGLRTGVAAYYVDKNIDQLAYHIIKYQERAGFTHKDVLRLCHPTVTQDSKNDLLSYVVGKNKFPTHPKLVAFENIKNTKDVKKAVALILEHDLPREVVPTELLNEVPIWEALLHRMPLTALIRNLGKMTQVGLVNSNFDESTKKICNTLTNKSHLNSSRIHPLSLFIALKTYASGHGVKGKLTWTPATSIIESLETAFYLSFDSVVPTKQNYLLALDVSGSTGYAVTNYPATVMEVEAVLAMVIARTEPHHEFIAFDHGIRRLPITSRQDLPSVLKTMAGWSGGATDCSLPMIYAAQNKLDVDNFCIFTDNETWSGAIHPYQSLNHYRQLSGKQAKLIVSAMTATNFTIANPNDPAMLDICGFSPELPSVINSFVLS